ncbi:MAG: adenylate/guanylate cyclase domain-containing protein [Acidimicrobiales bacterium]
MNPSVVQARADYESRRWADAVAGFEAAGPLALDDVERLAWSRLWTLAPAADCLEAFEQLEAAAVRENNSSLAARAALEQTRIHSMLANDIMATTSWARGMEHLGDADAPGMALGQVYAALGRSVAGDLEGSVELAGEALSLARQHDDITAEALARWQLGSATALLGDLDAGLAEVDRAMTMAVTEAVHPLYAGMITCGVVMLCRTIGDWKRAQEWTDVADRYCTRESVCHYPGHCSVFRSELTRAAGDFEMAATEAITALDLAGDWARAWTGMAHHQHGEALLCQGQLETAREAFGRAAEYGVDPQPGQARLLLVEGNRAAALRTIRRTLEGKGTYVDAEALPVLATGVSIAVANDDLDAAQLWADRLRDLAERFRTPAVYARASQAAGEVALARADHTEAALGLREAVDGWTGLGAPHDAARARVELARALDGLGQHAEATIERDMAAAIFERLGAVLELDALRGPVDVDLAVERRTFSFTDIVGSSELLAAMGDEAWGQVLSTHDRHLRETLVDFGGTEVKHEGDGLFVAFESEVAAVGWAVAVQQRLARHRDEHGFAPQVRVGVHCGEARRYGDDYIGRCVHETARIANAATGGEILVSADTAAKLVDGAFEVSAPRLLDLKGFDEPYPVTAIGWTETP